MKKPVEEMLESLQMGLLEIGGRLPSLDVPQNLGGIGDNNIEGKAYAQPRTHEGEQTIMTTTKDTTDEGSKSKGSVREVPPAGGRSDAEVADAMLGLLRRAQSALDAEAKPKTYGRKALDAAIPTAIGVVGAVALYAGVTVISSKWGRNSLVDRELALIESGKLRSWSELQVPATTSTM